MDLPEGTEHGIRICNPRRRNARGCTPGSCVPPLPGLIGEELFECCGVSRVAVAQRTQLLLEAVLAMMLALTVDVALDVLQFGSTHREGPVPRLPPEICCTLLLHPARRIRLQLLHDPATFRVRP